MFQKLLFSQNSKCKSEAVLYFHDSSNIRFIPRTVNSPMFLCSKKYNKTYWVTGDNHCS